MNIKWKTGQYSTSYGFVGKWNAFTISYSMLRDDPKPWSLRTSLPGRDDREHYRTQAEAKAGAEELWLLWLKEAGVRMEGPAR